MKNQPRVRVDRIKLEISRKGLKPGEISEHSGVKYDTLYKILNTDRPRTSAEVVAQLAAFFHCSIEYLLGMTDERAPITLAIPADLEELLDVAKRLPKGRRRDLIAIAQTYLDLYCKQQDEPDQLMDHALSLIEEYAGKEVHDRFMDVLKTDDDAGTDTTLHLGDSNQKV